MYLMRRKGFKGYGAVYDENAEWVKAYEAQYGSPTTRGLALGAGAAIGNTLTNLFVWYAFQPKKKKAFQIYSALTTIAAAGIGFWAGRRIAKNNMEVAYVIDDMSQRLAEVGAVVEEELPGETTVEVIEG